jgi:hypothetical protein
MGLLLDLSSGKAGMQGEHGDLVSTLIFEAGDREQKRRGRERLFPRLIQRQCGHIPAGLERVEMGHPGVIEVNYCAPAML